MSRPTLTYQPALDGLRAVAVGLVVLHHAFAFFAPEAYRRLFVGGFVGVDIFFVLSGFLITALLLQEAARTSAIRLGRFYLRRALRLFPALAAVLIVMSAFNLHRGEPGDQVLRSAASIAFYVVNWVKTFSYDVSPGLGHTWSLAVEEQFYLLWPLVVMIGIRYVWKLRTWVTVLAVGILLSAGDRAILWARSGNWEDVYYRTDARADALLVGALLAVLWTHRVSLRPARWFFFPSALLLLLIATGASGLTATSPFFYYGGFTVVALAAASLIACIVAESNAQMPNATRLLATPVLQHLGRTSYGIYLWHIPVFNVVPTYLTVPNVVLIPVVGVASIAAAEISMLVIERPFLQLKDRTKPEPDMVSTPG